MLYPLSYRRKSTRDYTQSYAFADMRVHTVQQ
jgi:hypothetical protein